MTRVCKWNYPYISMYNGKCPKCGHAKSNHYFENGRTVCLICSKHPIPTKVVRKRAKRKFNNYYNRW